MLEHIVENLLLSFEVSDDVSVELCFQLEPNAFNICYVIADLYNRSLLNFDGVFFGTFFSGFGNEVFEEQQGFWRCCPSHSALIRT